MLDILFNQRSKKRKEERFSPKRDREFSLVRYWTGEGRNYYQIDFDGNGFLTSTLLEKGYNFPEVKRYLPSGNQILKELDQIIKDYRLLEISLNGTNESQDQIQQKKIQSKDSEYLKILYKDGRSIELKPEDMPNPSRQVFRDVRECLESHFTRV